MHFECKCLLKSNSPGHCMYVVEGWRRATGSHDQYRGYILTLIELSLVFNIVKEKIMFMLMRILYADTPMASA